MRKALYFFSLIIMVAVPSLAQEGREYRDNLCERFKKDAQSGISSGKIIFKRFGMPVDLLSDETRDYLIKKYNLHIRQMGCIVVPGEQCYNEEIDAYFVQACGKHVYELIEEAQKATGQK